APNDAAALRDAVAAVPAAGSWAEHHAACRALDALGVDRVPDRLRARVALVGSYTLDPLLPFLRVAGARAGLWVDTYVAPYGQYAQELVRPDSGLYAFRPHATFVLIGGDALWEMRWARETAPGASAGSSAEDAEEFLSPLRAGLQRFSREGTGIVAVSDFVSLLPSAEGALGFRSGRSFAETVARANALLAAELSGRGSAFLLPLSEMVTEIGRARAVNRRTFYQGHVPWSDALMGELARRCAGMTAAARGSATKCIVLDLDNTLWGGVLGEEGISGIAIGQSWPGREYLDFQRQLLELSRQGILLAVCSKNNEPEALAVFREHPEQLIRERHLAAYRINWSDKATNIRELAAELNIGVDHMMLLDDSPHERSWVRQQIPQMLVPELPADASQYAAFVASLPSLVVLQRTEEDAQRTQQYREQQVRESFREGVTSEEDFLRTLDLRVNIEPMTEATTQRVVQLLGKTNQFNLTTRRHDEATLRRNAEAGTWRIYTMRVTDRFGDFGLTAVGIAVPNGTRWHLDTFLMSCRVIGKSVESAFLARIAGDAQRAGAQELTAEFIDSGRNQVAAGFLGAHGFAEQGEGDGRFTRSLREGLPWPEWIRDASSPAAADGHPTTTGKMEHAR
ncbi:MAG: HAD-IIIC family phosphatase, partial [Gemmatimonadaceae bacterium]